MGKANGEVWKPKVHGGTNVTTKPNPRRRAGNGRARVKDCPPSASALQQPARAYATSGTT